MLNSGMDQLVKFQLPEVEKERDELKKKIGNTNINKYKDFPISFQFLYFFN